MLDNNSRSKTVKGYAESINTLFRLRGFPVPVDLSDKNNMCTRLIDALENEEVIAKQRNPITNEMFANMEKLARESPRDSAISTIFDFFCLIRITGFRIAEYGQTTQTKVDMHEYPSGNSVVKAFLPTDWIFKNEKGRLIKIHALDVNTVAPSEVKITFRIQKNRQNGQAITITADNDYPTICPVRAAYRIFLRAKRLGKPDDQPMAVFVNNQGQTKYLTGSKIAEILQSVAKTTHPDMTPDEISRISSHSGRVWAVVLLDEAGKSPDFIKSRLRYMGDSYCFYLRDTSVIQHQHIEALKANLMLITKLLGPNHSALPDTVPIDYDMGNYDDNDLLESDR